MQLVVAGINQLVFSITAYATATVLISLSDSVIPPRTAPWALRAARACSVEHMILNFLTIIRSLHQQKLTYGKAEVAPRS